MVANGREAADAVAHATDDAGPMDGTTEEMAGDVAKPFNAAALGAVLARHLARRPAPG